METPCKTPGGSSVNPMKKARSGQPDFRSRVQAGVFAATVAAGLQFVLYVRQASGLMPMTIPRPHGVEGFLPIGALMGWKLFFTTGQWDRIHPAAMVIFGFAMLVSLAFSKSFCGWFCPVGTLSDWLFRIGRSTGRSFTLPMGLDLPLRSVKYILLAFFIVIISRMGTGEINGFIESVYYKTSDVRMLLFFSEMSRATAACLFLLALLSLFNRNFWCRYLCPYGALAGLWGLIGPTRITRDTASCVSCGRCTAACPNRISVNQTVRVVSPECTVCMRCVKACPVEGALSLRTKAIKKDWSERILGVIILGSYVSAVYIAIISGHWKSGVTDQEYRMFIHQIHAQPADSSEPKNE